MYIDENAIPYRLTDVEGQPAIWLAGAGCVRQEVVGESYNAAQMNNVVGQLQGRTDTAIVAWLMPEPENPHDRQAVMVWVRGGRVGYLPRELAQLWSPVLMRMRARAGGRHVAVHATLDPPSVANQGGYGLVIYLPAPAERVIVSQRNPFLAPTAPAAPVVPPESQRVPVSNPQPAPSVATPPVSAVEVTRPAPAPISPEKLEELRAEIADATTQLKRVKTELESVEEAIEIQSFGFYKPKYGFESSAQYTARLTGIKNEQQSLIKSDKAAPCDTKWTVGGSAAEGKKMVKQQAKLMLRAFNGEADAAITKVRYDNVTKMEQRLEKAYDDINKCGQVQQVFISRRYLDLKLAELHLVHEHREKVQEEKEEQKRIKEQMREEQRAEEEIAKAKAEAEKEEAKSAAALEKARAELAAAEATSKQHEKLESLVSRLETELKAAIEQKAKAFARAQLTKSGHVYVLSNIGSFGEGVFKIGLTRRLDPYERVEELGDASVPFPFDVHAIIYAEDAPKLENTLHKAFASRRVNFVNHRKEYFRVTLSEIEAEVKRAHGLVSFKIDPDAEEYFKTRAALDAGAPPPSAEDPKSGVVQIADDARARTA